MSYGVHNILNELSNIKENKYEEPSEDNEFILNQNIHKQRRDIESKAIKSRLSMEGQTPKTLTPYRKNTSSMQKGSKGSGSQRKNVQ
jgi:hypothetical protein